MFGSIKLGPKVMVISGLLILVPVVIVTVLSVSLAGRALDKNESAARLAQAEALATAAGQMVKGQEQVTDMIALRHDVIAATDDVSNERTQTTSPHISTLEQGLKKLMVSKELGGSSVAILCVDSRGIVFAATDPGYVGSSIGRHNYLLTAISGENDVGAVEVDKVSGKAVFPVAAPIYAPGSSEVNGVVVNLVNKSMLDAVVANVKVGRTGHPEIIARNGVVVFDPNKSLVLKLNALKEKDLKAVTNTQLEGGNGVVHYAFRGIKQIQAFAWVPVGKWSLGLTMPVAEYLAPVYQLRLLAGLVAAASLLFAVVILILFVRTITRPLRSAVAYAEVVAGGDFTRKLAARSTDEVGVLIRAMNGMAERLRLMFMEVRGTANYVAAASSEISSNAQRLAESSQNQASTVEEASASVEELTASVDQVARHAQNQVARAEESTDNMEHMRRSVEQVSQTLAEVSTSSGESMKTAQAGMEAVSKAVEAIESISKSSEQIAGIITVISDIADQTNLLALNASIEAARAGEHGRGFAVVADEVSKLADRSSSSAKEIGTLIKESASSVSSGVQIAQTARGAMEEIIAGARRTNAKVSTLTEDIEEQARSIDEVAKATHSVGEMSKSISEATEEQAVNANQVAQAMENVNGLIQHAASSAEEMSASTDELMALSTQLQETVKQFKLGEDTDEVGPPEPGQEETNLEPPAISAEALIGEATALDGVEMGTGEGHPEDDNAAGATENSNGTALQGETLAPSRDEVDGD